MNDSYVRALADMRRRVDRLRETGLIKQKRDAPAQRAPIYKDVENVDQLDDALTNAAVGELTVVNVTQEIFVDRTITIKLGANVRIESQTTPPQKITRAATFNIAALFRYLGDNSTRYSITLSNIIIDGNWSGGAHGSVFSYNKMVDLYMGYNGTSAFIENCDVHAYEGQTLFNFTINCGFYMQNSSEIHNCQLQGDNSASATVLFPQENSVVNINGDSKIYDITGVTVGKYHSVIISAQSNSTVEISQNASIFNNTVFYIAYYNSNNTKSLTIKDNVQIYGNTLYGPMFDFAKITALDGAFYFTGDRSRICRNTCRCIINLGEYRQFFMSGGAIDDNTISGNPAAVTLSNSAKAEVSGGIICDNKNALGNGGFATLSDTTNASIKITGCRFIMNNGINGGVIDFPKADNSVTIAGASDVNPPIFEDNTASGDGGAIYVADYADLTIGPNVRFKNNKASRYFNATANPAILSDQTRALQVDTNGMTYTSPFTNVFNNADVVAKFNGPGMVAPLVKYDAMGGDSTPADQLIDPTGSGLITPPVDTPTKPDFVFTGWHTRPTGGVRWSFATMTAMGALGVPPATPFVVPLFARYRSYNKKEQCRRRWAHGNWVPPPEWP